jgi:hypothetical protein
MNDDVVAFAENHSRHILRRRRSGLDEVEESVSSRLDMGTVSKRAGGQSFSIRFALCRHRRRVRCP